jgi:hypothetical protein
MFFIAIFSKKIQLDIVTMPISQLQEQKEEK